MTFQELYDRMYERLAEFKAEADRLEEELAKAESKYQRVATNLKQKEQQQRAEIERIRPKLNAFIGMAKAHTKNLCMATAPRPIDLAKLSRLSVQINPSLANDKSASLLYSEATAQLRKLQQMETECTEHTRFFLKPATDILKRDRANIDKQKERLKNKLATYFDGSEEYIAYVRDHTAYHKAFAYIEPNIEAFEKIEKNFLVGTINKYIPTPNGCADLLSKYLKYLYNPDSSTIDMPVCFDVLSGGVLYLDYFVDTDMENTHILPFFRHLICNLARYYGNYYQNIVFIDPVRYNGSALGGYENLAFGKNSFIEKIPTSPQEVDRCVNQILQELSSVREKITENRDKNILKKVLIFHNYPNGYSTSTADIIRQICMNAKYYGVPVILTHGIVDLNENDSVLNTIANQSVVAYKSYAVDNGWSVRFAADNKASWEIFIRSVELPQDIEARYIRNRMTANLSNDYGERVGFLQEVQYKKGVRYLDNISLGVDSEGNVVSIDMENTNFATFICGASRSGKSTLLHSLITSVVQNLHPDDVEIWLIDFKMTEFSRYIEHLPPHIRYILLDESPELVYDIIDRLSDILQKRQNMFKGNWQKLYEVPKEKYMPAILVVIDEFSVMSKIIAESAMTGTVNYKAKVETLLAKGAALGLHFIFASQGFTSGASGLSDFSKKQIQQRIAMKTEYSEIKETLDLKSTSEEDKAMMEQLEPHHALLRIPVDTAGNHLSLSKVIYISDYSKQEEVIDRITASVSPVLRFDPQDPTTYIHKKPVIVDGNVYQPFSMKTAEMQLQLQSYRNNFGEDALLFIGEPRRMNPICPIEVADSFMENILMVAPNKEKMPAVSVILSIIESLKMQGYSPVICANKKNPLFQQIHYGHDHSSLVTICGIQDICEWIRQTKAKIDKNNHGKEFYILLGFESLLLDMAYLNNSAKPDTPLSNMGVVSVGDNGNNLYYQARDKSKPDFMTQMAQLAQMDKVNEKKTGPLTSKATVSPVGSGTAPAAHSTLGNVYDARTDLKHLFEIGPNQGYHFMLVFNTVGEISQHRIDLAHFKHRITFKDSVQNARMFVGQQEGQVVFNLEDRCFRYSNGVNACSYRPYLHEGLTWDGWTLDKAGNAIHAVVEEEEYLL